jgi:hypothetical protein
MPGVEDVKLHVAASIDEIERAVVGIRGVTDRIDEALNRLRLITAGSAHPRSAEAVLQFEAAKEKLAEAQNLIMSGVDAAQAYRSFI